VGSNREYRERNSKESAHGFPMAFESQLRTQTEGCGGAPRMITLETTCRHCAQDLGGYVIRGEVMYVDDIAAFFSNRVTRETVNTWFLNGTLTGNRLPGIRGWWTTVAQFQEDLKKSQRKRSVRAAPDEKVKRGQ
jgi:hypothetical protein